MTISKKVAELSARLSVKPAESAKPETETPSPKAVDEVINVKTEKAEKKPKEVAATEKKVTTEKKTVIEDVKKEDDNGWFSFLKDFGF